MNDPQDDKNKITNQDEQDVVVNQSTATDNGYDQPVHESEKDESAYNGRKIKPEDDGNSKPQNS